jgi:hypothetical protein
MTRKWILITSALIILSCQENKDNKGVDIKNPIYTGIIDDNLSLNSYSIDFVLPINWDCGICDVEDSIDINNDGSLDIVLKARFFDPDAFYSPECCPPPADCWPDFIDFRITMLNDFEIAYSDIPFINSTGLGDIVSAFDYNTRIDTVSSWTQSTFFWMHYHDEPGSWKQFDQEKYIAIRKKSQEYYDFGWIKVKSSPFHNLVFIDSAIESN